jgi:hypothetical protein
MEDRWVKVEEGRYLAQHIKGAKYLELAGGDHVIWGEDSRRLVDEIQIFLSDLQAPAPVERVLLTVLALKLVGSQSQRQFGDQLLADVCAEEGKDARIIENAVVATFQGPTRAIRCAMTMRDRMQTVGLDLRGAIHVGECYRLYGEVRGSAIQFALRLLDLAEPCEIVSTRTVRDLVASPHIRFQERAVMEVPELGGARQCYVIGGLSTPYTGTS